jgi:hypothetical protein
MTEFLPPVASDIYGNSHYSVDCGGKQGQICQPAMIFERESGNSLFIEDHYQRSKYQQDVSKNPQIGDYRKAEKIRIRNSSNYFHITFRIV